MGLLQDFLGAPGSDQSNMLGLFAQGLSQRNGVGGLLAANQFAAAAPQRAMQQQLAQMQLERERLAFEKAKRDDSMEQQIGAAAKSSYRSPGLAQAMSTGPMPDGGAVQQVASGFDNKAFLDQLYGINPMKAIALEQSMKKETPFNKIDPKDYTRDSIARFSQTQNPADLVAARKMDVVNGQAADLYNTTPGTVFDNIDPNKPFNLKGGQAVPNTGFQQYEIGKAKAGASNVSVNTGQKGLDNELKIRSDFRSEPIYKAHQEVQSAHSQISSALKMGSPAGDLAGATKIMKILDPGSVVRESELGMAMAATGALDRLTNYADMVIKGTKLTPSQRVDFQKLGDSLMGESVKQYNAKRNEYGKFATDYGLDGDRILGPVLTSPKLPPSGKPSIGGPIAPGAGARFLGFE
jgi:hypothetical protein